MWIMYALCAAILWGLNCSLCERILGSVSPYFLLALQMLTGTLIFSSLAYLTTLKKDWRHAITEPNLGWLLVFDVLVVVASSICIMESIRTKDATSTGLIELIYPLFTVLFTWLFFHQSHLNASVIAGGTLICFGVVLIAR